MAQTEDLSFRPLDDWTFLEESEPDKGILEIFERDTCECLV
jgi:hypothetical protein